MKINQKLPQQIQILIHTITKIKRNLKILIKIH